MIHKTNRRQFLKRTAISAGALSVAQMFPGPSILRAASAGDKIRCALIGCGGRGMSHIQSAIAGEKAVALVDVSEPRFGVARKALQNKNADVSNIQEFTDYRKMFDKMAKQIDAVFIATPNHQHALPAMIAIQLGINVYCEKPVCHDIGEARLLRKMAREAKIATQMGNQGHCDGGYHRLCEFIQAGVIGKVTETHSWTDRANGGQGPRPPVEPVPAGMHWDAWIGPAPYRDFHSDIHPHEWHGWFDFGNGSIGNMGCHALDGVYWALKIEHPTSIEVEEMRGGSDERYPLGARIRWDCPARGDMPPVKVYWYEGLKKDAKGMPKGNLRTAQGADRNLPPLLVELQKKYEDERFDSTGSLYVGEKGVIYSGCYGEQMHIVPREKMNGVEVEKTLPRPKGIFADFLDAVRAGKKETFASFEYGTQLTEFAILGNLAQHVGPGKKVEWDGPNMKVMNIPELNAWVKREYRKGWQI